MSEAAMDEPGDLGGLLLEYQGQTCANKACALNAKLYRTASHLAQTLE